MDPPRAQEFPPSETLPQSKDSAHPPNYQKDIDDFIHIVEHKGWKNDLPFVTNHNFVSYFLEAKDWDIGGAIDLLQAYIQWRSEQGIGHLDFEKVKKELEMFKLFVLPDAVDTKGNLVCLFISRRHFPSQSPITDFVSMIIFLLEHYLCSEQKYTGYTIINDMTDVRWGNFDFKLLNAVRGLQYCFPLMPHKILINNPPYVFKMVWGMARPVLSEHVQSLIEITQTGDLTKYIDPEHLPLEYGGTMQVNNDEWLKSLTEKNHL